MSLNVSIGNAEYHGYVVGWGTVALINANLAQVKKRSGPAWFFISFLLGPIVTFLLAVMDSRG